MYLNEDLMVTLETFHRLNNQVIKSIIPMLKQNKTKNNQPENKQTKTP